jgi:argininosuccinate lyase
VSEADEHPAPEPGTLWAGNFSSAPAAEAHALGRSIAFDRRLAAQDAQAGIAHVGSLVDAGVIPPEDAKALEGALEQVAAEIEAGTFVFHDEDEDVHSAIERAVTERLGDLGARLHAGRSRNDLVVTDFRLWLLAATARIEAALSALAEVITARAGQNDDTVMPGSTHSRFAQPVTLGHLLMAYVWELLRDLERFDQWAERSSVSALGAGAIATSTLGLDPDATAARLGMRQAFTNSIDAVSDRDFAQEFLAVSTICATHLSRLGADVVRWTDGSLGWADLDEAFSTGSSMMPQKRNPDTAELVRGKAARIAGDMAAVTALLQGLPMGYHRDLQEDKEPVFDAADTLELVLPAITGAMRTIRFNPQAMREACAAGGLYATDVAEALVARGLPFREAHRRTGELIKDLRKQGRSLEDLSENEWEELGVAGGGGLLDPDRSVHARSMPGGPSPASVRDQVDAASLRLSERSRPAESG